MCYEAKCSGCGKVTWGGCGRHVQSVYNRIEESQRCLCKDWPGVDLTLKSTSNSNSNSNSSSTNQSSCNIL